MKDSRIGTNGTLVLILLIISKIILLKSINQEYIYQCLIVMPVVSRMNIVWASGLSSYARQEKGLATSIVNNTGIKEIIISTCIAGIISGVFLNILSIIALPPAILFVILFIYYVKKRLSGITGDIIGAVIELSELVFLLSLIVYESIKTGTGV